MKIKAFSIYRLTKPAHLVFVTNVLEAAQKDETVMEKCQVYVEKLAEAVQAERDNYNIEPGSSITNQINAADRDRNRMYQAYRQSVLSALNLNDPAKNAAAEKLMRNIKMHKISSKMRINSKTAELMKLVDDLKGKYSADVETLEVGHLVKNVERANNKYIQLVSDRNSERANKIIGVADTSRRDSNLAYKKFVNVVNSFVEIDDSVSELDDFIKFVNEMIKFNNDNIAKIGSKDFLEDESEQDEMPAEE